MCGAVQTDLCFSTKFPVTRGPIRVDTVEKAMVLNKRLLFSLVAKGTPRWGEGIATRARIRRQDNEHGKTEELAKWEDEGGDVPAVLAKAPI